MNGTGTVAGGVILPDEQDDNFRVSSSWFFHSSRSEACLTAVSAPDRHVLGWCSELITNGGWPMCGYLCRCFWIVLFALPCVVVPALFATGPAETGPAETGA